MLVAHGVESTCACVVLLFAGVLYALKAFNECNLFNMCFIYSLTCAIIIIILIYSKDKNIQELDDNVIKLILAELRQIPLLNLHEEIQDDEIFLSLTEDIKSIRNQPIGYVDDTCSDEDDLSFLLLKLENMKTFTIGSIPNNGVVVTSVGHIFNQQQYNKNPPAHSQLPVDEQELDKRPFKDTMPFIKNDDAVVPPDHIANIIMSDKIVTVEEQSEVDNAETLRIRESEDGPSESSRGVSDGSQALQVEALKAQMATLLRESGLKRERRESGVESKLDMNTSFLRESGGFESISPQYVCRYIDIMTSCVSGAYSH
jgi:hypothetical protein